VQVEITEAGSTVLIRARGRIDSNTSPEFENRILPSVRQDAERVVLCLAGVEYVSSAGLRVFLMMAKRLRATGGRFVVCEMTEAVHHVFRISGFLKIIPVVGTEEEALAP
jgi:anti-anti-sigma factor